jgi:hypothetical protein
MGQFHWNPDTYLAMMQAVGDPLPPGPRDYFGAVTACGSLDPESIQEALVGAPVAPYPHG